MRHLSSSTNLHITSKHVCIHSCTGLSGFQTFLPSLSSDPTGFWSQLTNQFSIWLKISACVIGFRLNSSPAKIILHENWRREPIAVPLVIWPDLVILWCPEPESSDGLTGERVAPADWSVADWAGELTPWIVANGDAGLEAWRFRADDTVAVDGEKWKHHKMMTTQ